MAKKKKPYTRYLHDAECALLALKEGTAAVDALAQALVDLQANHNIPPKTLHRAAKQFAQAGVWLERAMDETQT